jgi:NNP family nitrate/nitrite transporter-like MFS transporter
VGGFFLGIAGTAFAVGVPFVNAWFPPEKRGLAIGIFGAGMGGTAISALTTVKLYENLGTRSPFLISAAVLAVYAGAAWLVLRDAPGRTAPTTSLMTRLAANARLPITWQACILYAVAFGGYVAFSVYLPSYLKTAHGLTPADAANRMAGFVVVAVIMRPVGGWLSDRLGAVPVLAGGYAVVVMCAAISAGTPPLDGVGTVAFLAMAAALGSGSGATFALIAKVTDPSRVGGGDRSCRCRRRARRLRAAVDHGLRLRANRLLRDRAVAALGHRGPDPGPDAHRGPPHRRRPRPCATPPRRGTTA